jgi:predicted nucleic acid-binding protein
MMRAVIEACRDPKDNKVLEAAFFGQADMIVTGDEDLFALDPFKEIRILSLPDFLARLRAG